MSDSKKTEDKDTSKKQDGGEKQPTAADFDKLVREAEEDTKTAKPGQSQGGNSQQHNNGRGGGK
jgi:hypothetical protein